MTDINQLAQRAEMPKPNGPIIFLTVTTKDIEKVLGESKDKEEKYEFKPDGFEYAPVLAQKYWKELEKKGDDESIKKMQYLQSILAYNADGTVIFLKFKKRNIFCVDFTSNGATQMHRQAASDLTKSKGYDLLTDWNECDDEETRKDTDRYRIEEVFGDYRSDGTITHMLGCIPGRYRTGTKYKDKNGIEISGVARFRCLATGHCSKEGSQMVISNRVCGIKDSM